MPPRTIAVEPPAEATVAPLTRQWRNPRARLAARTLFFILASGMMTWLVISALRGESHRWMNALFLPASVVLVTGLFILRDERKWNTPSKKLLRLIPQLRAGEAPIEELSHVTGGLTEIAALLQETFRELRRQKNEMAQLQQEMGQRVARRTDALERQLGTLRHQASRDPLTGLFNRRTYDGYLQQAMEKCRNVRADLTLLMIDVDHFKPLNDTLGHAAGDELLRNIGQVIRSGIRTHDSAFRVGGDEFVIVLPGCPAEPARLLANRMAELVEALTRPLRVNHPPRLSIGLATMSEIKSATPQSLTEEADRRLYEAKSARKKLQGLVARSA